MIALWPVIPVMLALMLSRGAKAFGRSHSPGSIPSGGGKRPGRAQASARPQGRAEAKRLPPKKRSAPTKRAELPDPLAEIMDHAMPPEPVAQHAPSRTPKKRTHGPAPTPPLPAAKRSPKEAAAALLAYVTPITKAKQSSILGTKGKPNTVVATAQTDMGGLPVDGIYGPETRARGKALIGKSFPPR